MKYFVYVLENSFDMTWYVGFTINIEGRIIQHNTHTGGNHTKSKEGIWKPIYYEAYINKEDALKREKFLKSGSGKSFIKKQISNYLSR